MRARLRPTPIRRIGAVPLAGAVLPVLLALTGCSSGPSRPLDDGGQGGVTAVQGLDVEVIDPDQPVLAESATVVDALGEAGLEARSHPASSPDVPGLAFEPDTTGGLLFTVGNLGMKRSRTGHYVVLAFATPASARLFAATRPAGGEEAVFERDAWQQRARAYLAGTLLAYATPAGGERGGDPEQALTSALRRLAGVTAATPSATPSASSSASPSDSPSGSAG